MSKFVKKEPDFVLSQEVAIAQVQILTEYYGIDPDSKEKESGEAMETLLERLARFVRQGFVEIHDNATVTQKLQNAPGEVHEVTYRRINGADTVAAGKAGEAWSSKLWALLASVADCGEGIRKLTGKDIAVAEVLGAVFYAR